MQNFEIICMFVYEKLCKVPHKIWARDRFRRFAVYRIQTKKQTNRQAKYIDNVFKPIQYYE